jgi:hypothetical protein
LHCIASSEKLRKHDLRSVPDVGVAAAFPLLKTTVSILPKQESEGARYQSTYSVSLQLSTLQDLLHALLVIGSAEFVLETGLACAVKNTLGTVPVSSMLAYTLPSSG